MILKVFRGLAWGRRLWSRIPGRRRTIYVGDRIDEYRGMWSASAAAIGAEFTELAAGIWEIRRDGRAIRIANDLVPIDDPVVLAVAGDKSFCYEVAARVGLPTPDPATHDRGQLEHVLARTPGRFDPVVVKPARNTSAGIGVSIGVASRFELAGALALASTYSDRVIIERMIAAETVRLLFLDGEMINAVRRRGVRVVGDGVATIAELLRRTPSGPVPSDRFVALTLAQQGRSLGDVVPAGSPVVARWLPSKESHTRELRTIYTEDVTSLVGADLVRDVAALVGELGTRFAGVDLLTNDPSRPLAETGGVFLEVNTTPGLHHHCGPRSDGAPCPVVVTVLRRLLEGPIDDRVPPADDGAGRTP